MQLRSPFRRCAESLVVLAGLLLLLVWDASSADVRVARWAGGPDGFALRHHWLLEGVLHQGARAVGWTLVVWLGVGLRWPAGVLRAISPARRTWLLAATIGGMLLVSTLKRGSLTSCPWDLQEFGGMVRHVSHWAWLQADGGPGHCFPAGHASAALAWVAGWFAFRDVRPDVARAWLATALLAGAAIGVAQQLRGAHFASHTLWTAWICWTWSWALSAALPPQKTDAPAAG